jgi:hypothetical protein
MRRLDAGEPLEVAKVGAYRDAHAVTVRATGEPFKDPAVARLADGKLRKTVIREAMSAYLEAETDMSPGEMLNILVTIARGENIDPKTTPIQLRALDSLQKLVFIPATQRVEVDSRSTLSAVVVNDLSSSVPRMDARVVSPLPVSGGPIVEMEPVSEADDE